MLAWMKLFPVAAAVMLAVSLPLSFPAVAAPVSSDTSMQSGTTAQLQRGDLVRLRSGGPLMTVNDVRGDQVDCYWTDWNGQPNDATFPVSVLQKL